jgi:NADH-quinone oxidoreductase subunit F
MDKIDQIIEMALKDEQITGLPARGCLIACLKAAQAKGGVTNNIKQCLEKALGVTRTDIEEVLSAYDMFGIASGKKSEELYRFFLGDQRERAKEIRVRGPLLQNARIEDASLTFYRDHGGYGALKKAVGMTPEAIIAEIKSSNLRGFGGAYFPVWMKWDAVRKEQSDIKFILVNADEGEPPTVKDQVLLEQNPHLLLEGVAIAGLVTGAHTGVIYVRGDYTLAIERLKKAITEAESAGILGENVLGSGFAFHVRIFEGAGSYVAGADVAMLESIEGKPARSRSVPPYPVQSGISGKPTVVNNVETLANVPNIIANGSTWYAANATKLYGLSGAITKPGIYELPIGVTLGKLLEMGGGVFGNFKAALPGGVTTPVVTDLSAEMSVEGLKKVGSFLGSGAVGVISDITDVATLARLIMEFLREESCGKCFPCANGTYLAVKYLKRLEDGKNPANSSELLDAICKAMPYSCCGLGKSVPGALKALITLLPAKPAVKRSQS